jgi:hypothetical protein
VPLVSVELSFGEPFELDGGDADVLVQLRGGDVMWQKERLLNVALLRLPADCDQVAWIDADVLFERESWAEATKRLLDRFAMIQLFQRVDDLGPGQIEGPPICTSESMGQRIVSGAATEENLPAPGRAGCSGLAWAARREALEEAGFYDPCIVGSGDRAMALAAYGRPDLGISYLRMNQRRAEHYRRWARDFYAAVRGDIGCLEGTIRHLWHGSHANRRHAERHLDFSKFDFDPALDIAIDDHGCWRWSSHKTELHAFVRDYFPSRREDD